MEVKIAFLKTKDVYGFHCYMATLSQWIMLEIGLILGILKEKKKKNYQSWRISRISPTVCKDKINSLGSWFNTSMSTDFLSFMLKQSELTVICQLDSLLNPRKQQIILAHKGTDYELQRWQSSKSSRGLFAGKDAFNSFCVLHLKISPEPCIHLPQTEIFVKKKIPPILLVPHRIPWRTAIKQAADTTPQIMLWTHTHKGLIVCLGPFLGSESC